MKRPFLVCLSCFFTAILLSAFAFSPGTTISNPEYRIEKEPDQTYPGITHQTFQAWSVQKALPMPMGRVIWFRFEVTVDTLQTESTVYLDFNLAENHGIYQSTLYYAGDSIGQKAGAWVPKQLLPMPENRFVHRITLPPGSSEVIYLRITSKKNGSLSNFQISAREPEDLRNARLLHRAKHFDIIFVHQGSFWTTLLFCLILAAVQYHWYREPAYLYYLIYILCLGLLYLRSIEEQFGSILSEQAGHGYWLFTVEVPLQYLIFGAYTLFIYYFLDLAKHGQVFLDRLFKGIAIFFLSLALLQIPVILLGPPGLEHTIYDWIRQPFLPVMVIIILYLLYHYRSPFNLFVLAGVIILALPAACTALFGVLEGRYGYLEYGHIIRRFHFYDSKVVLPMYSTRLGIMLEIVVFALALSYKNRVLLLQWTRQKELAPSVVKPDPFLDGIRQQILAHLDQDDYSIEDLCRDLGISRSQLHQRVKTAAGVSTSHFIRSVRLEEAKKLLSGTTLSVSEVAYQVGFSDPNYFTRTFTGYFGMSPKRVREG